MHFMAKSAVNDYKQQNLSAEQKNVASIDSLL